MSSWRPAVKPCRITTLACSTMAIPSRGRMFEQALLALGWPANAGQSGGCTSKPHVEPATALAMVSTETWTAFSLGTVLRAFEIDQCSAIVRVER